VSLYCDVEDVKTLSQVEYQQLGFASDAAYEGWISGTLIPMAIDAVNNYVGHNFYLNHGTILVDGSGKRVQLISRSASVVYSNQAETNTGDPEPAELLPLPLIAITGLSIDGVAEDVDNVEVYQTHLASESTVFSSGRLNVEIVGTWGYGTYPEDIRYVTAQVSANILTEMIRRRMLPDVVTPVLESGNVSERVVRLLTRTPLAITRAEKNILDKYRFHNIEVG